MRGITLPSPPDLQYFYPLTPQGNLMTKNNPSTMWRLSTVTVNHAGGRDYTFKRVSADGMITSLHTVTTKDFWRGA